MYTSPSQDKPLIHEGLLAVVRQVVAEIHPGPVSFPITLTTRLDLELGFDSLSRVELLSRIEQTFSVKLPESALMEAETPADLVKFLNQAESWTPPQSLPAVIEPVATSAEGLPDTVSTLTELLRRHAQLLLPL